MSYETASPDAPLLFVDVDGVVSLFGFDSGLAGPGALPGPGTVHLFDGMAHYIPVGIGERLVRLAERFELVWATGWEEKANEHLPLTLGLPFDRLACLDFGGRAVFGSSDWKVDALATYAGDRPAAWIDDNLGDLPRWWAQARTVPTMLVETRCHEGLTDEHVEALLDWAGAVAQLSGRRRDAAEAAY